MKKVLGVQGLAIVFSIIATAAAGVFITFPFVSNDNHKSVYSLFEEALDARDEAAVVDHRMDNIKNAVAKGLRRGKVIEAKSETPFVLSKRDNLEDEKNTPEATNLEHEFTVDATFEKKRSLVSKKLNKYSRNGSGRLTVILNGIKNSTSINERDKKSLELLENRFVFAWNAKSLKENVYEQLGSLSLTQNGAPYVTVKSVRKGENNQNEYSLQVWMADGTSVQKTDKEIIVNEWPFESEARPEVGRLTETSPINRSLVAADMDDAREIAQDPDAVKDLVSLLAGAPMKESQSDDSALVGGLIVTPVGGSGVGTSVSDLKENCIVPGPEGCTVDTDKDDDPRSKLPAEEDPYRDEHSFDLEFPT